MADAIADLIDGYAEALFSVAGAEGVLAAVEDELYALRARRSEQNTPLREALTDAALPAENKKARGRRAAGRPREPGHRRACSGS